MEVVFYGLVIIAFLFFVVAAAYVSEQEHDIALVMFVGFVISAFLAFWLKYDANTNYVSFDKLQQQNVVVDIPEYNAWLALTQNNWVGPSE